MPFKAAVFDLDGTLLDSLHDIANSMNAALRRKGFPEHPVVDYNYHVGDGMAILAKRVLPTDQINDAAIAELVGLMREEYGARWADTTRPYAGIPELLDELTRRRIRLAIVSNKPHDFSQQITARLLPQWRFDPVIGSRHGVPNKPDPAGALEAAAALKLAPSECVFIGDTYADMRTAASAGMYPAGVLWGFRGAQELLDNGAKMLAKHPLELLSAFA
ncbi:MAG: HAD family hydrolase [Planctomycetota bacterium]